MGKQSSQKRKVLLKIISEAKCNGKTYYIKISINGQIPCTKCRDICNGKLNRCTDISIAKAAINPMIIIIIIIIL